MFLLLHVSVLLQKHGYFTIYSNMLLTYHPQERKYPTKIHPPAKHSLVFQVFIKFMTIFLLFYVLAFWHVGSYLPDQGLNPHSLTLEGEVSTTGPAGKFPTTQFILKHQNFINHFFLIENRFVNFSDC